MVLLGGVGTGSVLVVCACVLLCAGACLGFLPLYGLQQMCQLKQLCGLVMGVPSLPVRCCFACSTPVDAVASASRCVLVCPCSARVPAWFSACVKLLPVRVSGPWGQRLH
jgi:hypothetical protein